MRVDEQRVWGGSAEKGIDEGLGMFYPRLLFRSYPPTGSILHPAPPEPVAYSLGSL